MREEQVGHGGEGGTASGGPAVVMGPAGERAARGPRSTPPRLPQEAVASPDGSAAPPPVATASCRTPRSSGCSRPGRRSRPRGSGSRRRPWPRGHDAPDVDLAGAERHVRLVAVPASAPADALRHILEVGVPEAARVLPHQLDGIGAARRPVDVDLEADVGARLLRQHVEERPLGRGAELLAVDVVAEALARRPARLRPLREGGGGPQDLLARRTRPARGSDGLTSVVTPRASASFSRPSRSLCSSSQPTCIAGSAGLPPQQPRDLGARRSRRPPPRRCPRP